MGLKCKINEPLLKQATYICFYLFHKVSRNIHISTQDGGDKCIVGPIWYIQTCFCLLHQIFDYDETSLGGSNKHTAETILTKLKIHTNVCFLHEVSHNIQSTSEGSGGKHIAIDSHVN